MYELMTGYYRKLVLLACLLAAGHLGHSTTADSYPSHAGVRLEQPHPTALHNVSTGHTHFLQALHVHVQAY